VDGIGSRSDVFKGTGFCQQAPNTGGNNNTIGGAAPGAGNLVSGNIGDGVVVLGTGNTVAGNRIGVTAAITGVLGNGGNGVVLTAFCEDGVCTPSSNNTIGGTAPGAGNMVGGNRGNGVLIDGTGGGVSNAVQGNAIGANIGGTVSLGNGANGVVLGNGAVGDTIGGTTRGAGNLIAHNGEAGVLIGASAVDTATHSAVQRNAIFANGGLGIDLAPRGVVNCATPPPGPNDYTPCPLIQTASTTAISGTACANCTVEVYLASNESDDQGHGEGQRLLGSVTASANGAWSLALATGQVSAGQRVTASATTPVAFGVAAETSEFAANAPVGS
jgi:titin